MLTLKQLRKKIDNIDSSIIKKLSARQQLSMKIGRLKVKKGSKVLDLKREMQLMRLYEHLSDQYDLNSNFIKRLFKLIIQHSRRIQK